MKKQSLFALGLASFLTAPVSQAAGYYFRLYVPGHRQLCHPGSITLKGMVSGAEELVQVPDGCADARVTLIGQGGAGGPMGGVGASFSPAVQDIRSEYGWWYTGICNNGTDCQPVSSSGTATIVQSGQPGLGGAGGTGAQGGVMSFDIPNPNKVLSFTGTWNVRALIDDNEGGVCAQVPNKNGIGGSYYSECIGVPAEGQQGGQGQIAGGIASVNGIDYTFKGGAVGGTGATGGTGEELIQGIQNITNLNYSPTGGDAGGAGATQSAPAMPGGYGEVEISW